MKIILWYLLVASIITIIMILTGMIRVSYKIVKKADNFLGFIKQLLTIIISIVFTIITSPYHLIKWIILCIKINLES